MLKFKNKIFFLLCLSSISACASSTTSSSWDCPRQKGVGCVNINGADNSSLNSDNHNSNKCGKSCKKHKKILIKNLKKKENLTLNQTSNNMTSSLDINLRSSEKVSRVMFSDFIDSNGNKHEPSIVYYVDEQTSWIK